jgi:type IV pilus assembly protein PilB
LIVATADPSDHEAAERIKFITQWAWSGSSASTTSSHAWSKSTANHRRLDGQHHRHGLDFDEAALDSTHRRTPPTNALGRRGRAGGQLPAQDAAGCHQLRASDFTSSPTSTTTACVSASTASCGNRPPPIAIKDKLASRIKVISRLDISEKRVPQDGRMKLKVGPDRVIDFRVSTLPTLFGEKIVIRILDPSSAKLGIDALGYEPEEKSACCTPSSGPTA